MKLKKLVPAFAWLLAIAAACGSPQSPKTPAQRIGWDFIDAYYVKMDLAQAANLADGLAGEKIRQSQNFREGLSPDAAAHRPRVDFKVLSAEETAEEATVVYEITIQPDKAESRAQKTRLKLRLKDGAWKVTQFSDF